MLPKNVSETEVSALFSKYGTIKDLQILRGSQQTSKGTCSKSWILFWLDCASTTKIKNFTSSSLFIGCSALPFPMAGCAFLKYETKEQAIASLEAINGKHKMEVCAYYTFWWKFILVPSFYCH
jgi:CUG-BP- and ETR3-like factor